MSDRYGVDPAYVASPGTKREVIRRVGIVVGVLVGFALLVGLFSSYIDPRVEGPFGSSFTTTGHGVGAWHDVLEELGRPTTQSRVAFPEASVTADATVVVVDPQIADFDAEYMTSLLEHAESGGRVVLVGVFGVEGFLGEPIRVVEAGVVSIGVVPGPFSTDVTDLAVRGGDRYAGHGGEAIVTDTGGDVVVRFVIGAGDIVAVSDPWLFSNILIPEADNGVLAVRLVGGGPVVFDEFVHGFGVDQGPTALGAGLLRFVVVGTIGALVAMWAVGRRLGPPEQRSRSFPPSRAEYLDALGTSLAKTGDYRAYEPLRVRSTRAIDRVASRYVGLSREEQDLKAGAHFGLAADEVATLARPPANRAEAAAVASVAAKIERAMERTRTWTN